MTKYKIKFPCGLEIEERGWMLDLYCIDEGKETIRKEKENTLRTLEEVKEKLN